jgi:hypothetical protein
VLLSLTGIAHAVMDKRRPEVNRVAVGLLDVGAWEGS